MAHARLNDDELVERISEIFRSDGYEGASLSRIAAATGMEKASLYFRFPGGKQDMVDAVIRRVNEWFRENVLAPLAGPETPVERLKMVAKRLKDFYGDGKKSCVLDTLSLPAGSDRLREALRETLIKWMQAFTNIAKESGFAPAEARARAERAIIDLEGSLVVSRVLADPKPFRRALERLPNLLTGEGK